MKKILAALLMLLCSSCAFGLTGSGTSDDPYIIEKVSDMDSIAVNPSACYLLSRDIQMTLRSYWDPINFSGTFDGNGKVIYVHMIPEFEDGEPVEYKRALFGTLSGTVKNLYISGYVSSLRAAAVALTLQGGTIEGCTVSADIEAPADVEVYGDTVILAGGFVCSLNSGGINNCTFNGNINITGGEDYFASAGGIAAQMTGTTGTQNISGCSVLPVSLITGEGDGVIAGGIAGYMNVDFDNTISDCSFEGIINSECYAGGIVGYQKGGTLSNNILCDDSAVSGGLSAGGIVGYMDSGATADSNMVEAGSLVSSDVNAGGIAGTVLIAAVTGNTSYATLGGNADNKGGVIGEVHNYENASATITGNEYDADYAIGLDENGNKSNGTDNEEVDAAFSVVTVPMSTGKISVSYPAVTLITNADDDSEVTWSIEDGALPEGLELDEDSGIISGTPEEAGDFPFTVKAAKSSLTATKEFSITIEPAMQITDYAILDSPTFAEYYSFTLHTDSENPEYLSWSLADDSRLPDGLTLGPLTGEISGKPKEAGTFIFTVIATERTLTAEKEFTLLVIPKIIITAPSTLPSAVSGDEYSFILSCDAPAGNPVTWSYANGYFPNGLELDELTGEISGIPEKSGTYTFGLSARIGTIYDYQDFTLTVTPSIIITSNTTLPNAQFGEYYSCDITANLPNLSWTLADGSSLPEGLSLSLTSGEIYGTPEESGTFTFTIVAASNDLTAEKSFSLTIRDDIIFVTTSPLPTAIRGLEYSCTLEAVTPSNTNITWARTSGTLPPGFELNKSTGEISGTAEEEGTYEFAVLARAPIYRQYIDGTTYIYGYIRAIKTYRLIVAENIKISGDVLLTADAGYDYQCQLNADTPAVWTVESGDLPSGLRLNRTSGLIYGKPDTAGEFTFTVKAVSGDLHAEKTYTMTINFTITSGPSLRGGVVGTSYSYTLQAAGVSSGLVVWSADTSMLPSGLALSSNGIISGTPTNTGTSNFTVYALGGEFSARKAVNITVYDSAEDVSEDSTALNETLVTITTSSLPDGTTGQVYYAELTSMNEGVKWSIDSGELPPGLVLDSEGIISGTPSTAGEYDFVVKALYNNSEGTRRLSITITGGGTASDDKTVSGDTASSSGGGGGCDSGFGIADLVLIAALRYMMRYMKGIFCVKLRY